MVQARYWHELYQLKTHTVFIETKLHQAELIDRGTKIILAITSSSSIAGWAIFQEYAFIWAAIIATAQVLTAISPHLPYKQRIKAYSQMATELSALLIKAEYQWLAVANGQMNTEEVHNARFKILTQKQKILDKFVKTTIPIDSKAHQKAEDTARNYFTQFYPE